MASRAMKVAVEVADLPEIVQAFADLRAERDRLRAAVDAALKLTDHEPQRHRGPLCMGCQMAIVLRRAMTTAEGEQ